MSKKTPKKTSPEPALPPAAAPLPRVTPPPPELPEERATYVPQGQVLPLWPGKPPGETAAVKKEYTGIVRGYPHGEHLNIMNVWTPQIEVFPASPLNNTGAAVIVCPGGCYKFLSYTMEGVELARWLNDIGVTAVILKYRTPARPKAKRGEMELKDAQRAISLVRANAAQWGVDPKRVGISGFSAGAHLSALAGTALERTYDPVDEADKKACRPDFTLLFYPAYIFEEDDEVRGLVSAKTAPAFIIQAADDPYPSESSLAYYNACRAAGVSAELHVYASGGHGYGLRKSAYPSRTWTLLATEWLRENGWLG
ncbi:MAG: alpha/beta hydrolase [Puniceicoccales bacterium]|jgi:acetyl esterase/lipase|nr:alpha/beta hydrolase [Puniceicoccales bacterium]